MHNITVEMLFKKGLDPNELKKSVNLYINSEMDGFIYITNYPDTPNLYINSEMDGFIYITNYPDTPYILDETKKIQFLFIMKTDIDDEEKEDIAQTIKSELKNKFNDKLADGTKFKESLSEGIDINSIG